mgnify:CR=1 FL=1
MQPERQSRQTVVFFVSANWDDWKFGKATIRYVAGVSVNTDEKTTAAEAQNAVQDAALAQAKSKWRNRCVQCEDYRAPILLLIPAIPMRLIIWRKPERPQPILLSELRLMQMQRC